MHDLGIIFPKYTTQETHFGFVFCNIFYGIIDNSFSSIDIGMVSRIILKSHVLLFVNFFIFVFLR